MKILMENFNKFLEEQEMPEVEMEEEEESPDLEMAMDELLDDILQEGILSEYGVGDEYDHLRSSPDEEPASKEEVKSGIKQIIKSSEGQKVAQEIEKAAEQQAGDSKPSSEDYILATKNLINNGALGRLASTAATIPVFSFFGALFGGAGAEPHHSSSMWLNNPEAISKAVKAAEVMGAYGGAAAGSLILALVISHMVGKVGRLAKMNQQYRTKGIPDKYRK